MIQYKVKNNEAKEVYRVIRARVRGGPGLPTPVSNHFFVMLLPRHEKNVTKHALCDLSVELNAQESEQKAKTRQTIENKTLAFHWPSLYARKILQKIAKIKRKQ